MKHIVALLVAIIAFTGCTSKDEQMLSDNDAELLASVKRVQDETGLSNAEMESAIIRGAKVLSAFDGAFKEGLITEEEFKRMPALVRELEELNFDSDSYAAAVAFQILKSHHEGDMEKLLPFLRKTVADHYQDVQYKTGDEYAGFIKRVEDYAAKDEKLKKLLKKSG